MLSTDASIQLATNLQHLFVLNPRNYSTQATTKYSMDKYGYVFNIEMLLSNIIAVALTVLFIPPGEYTVDAALFNIDLFYVFFVLFAALAFWSGFDLWKSYSRTGCQQKS